MAMGQTTNQANNNKWIGTTVKQNQPTKNLDITNSKRKKPATSK